MSSQSPSLSNILSKHTAFFGIKLWVVLILFLVLLVAVFLVVFLSIIYLFRQKSKSKFKTFKPLFLLPNVMSCNGYWSAYTSSSLDKRLLSSRLSGVEMNVPNPDHYHLEGPVIEPYGIFANSESAARAPDHAWNGNRYSLRDIDVITNGFADENVIGNGDYGIIYRGITMDATRVAVKLLLSTCCQIEEFVAHVEAIGHVRHKNLVRLLGFCVEGNCRVLVNEYVDNGNLHQWLHGCEEQFSPLTWSIRMNIIQGVAKGLAYLHEDMEPKIAQQNLKSRNILLDHQWNPKLSDFGILKLFGPERNRAAARLLGTSGYLSQEYACDGVLNERTDVYSFGILIMEIITGRFPADHDQPHVYLIDWLKSMVASHKVMYVADPKLAQMPSSKDLKRILLLAFRCVDPDIDHRPTMGDVIHMLEPRNILLNDEWGSRRGSGR